MAKQDDLVGEEKVRAARAKAAFVRPYFAHALYALVLRQTTECPTMAVDKWARLYWSPAYVHACSIDELAVVFLHEIGHLLRRHHDRAKALGVTDATHKIANWAQDMELNDDLRAEVTERKDLPQLPGSPWYPEHIGCPEDQVWEVYYAHMMDHVEQLAAQLAEGQEGDGEGGDGDGGDQEGGAQGKGQGKKPGGGQGKKPGGGGSEKARNACPQCGSGADGVPRPWEDGDPGRTGKDGVYDADWRDVERRVAEAIRDQEKKSRGTVPGGWVTWSDAILRPVRIPWDVELAGALRWSLNDVAGMVTHSYRRPSRRQSAFPDVVMPSMRRPIPRVAVVGDTSGSMSEEDLALVRGTINDICSSLGAQVTFIATDAAVHGIQRVHDGRNAEMRGRGGTDMRVGIECALNDVRPAPDVIVVLTDCETPWPAEAPHVRVVIGAVRAREHSVATCPQWARVVLIDPEEGGAK